MQKLTKAQRRAWDINGYFVVKGGFAPDEVTFYLEQIDDLRSKPGWEPTDLPRGHYGWVEHADPNTESFMDRRDLLSYHQCFIDLIDLSLIHI